MTNFLTRSCSIAKIVAGLALLQSSGCSRGAEAPRSDRSNHHAVSLPVADLTKRSFDEISFELRDSYAIRRRKIGDPTAFQLHGLWVAPDETSGWAVGDKGTIVEYDRSRRNQYAGWRVHQEAFGLTRASLGGVAIEGDGEHGWAVGERGTVLRLEDGRWRKASVASSLTSVALESIVVSPDGTAGWAAGGSTRFAGCESLVLNHGKWTVGPSCGDLRQLRLGRGSDGSVWLTGHTENETSLHRWTSRAWVRVEHRWGHEALSMPVGVDDGTGARNWRLSRLGEAMEFRDKGGVWRRAFGGQEPVRYLPERFPEFELRLIDETQELDVELANGPVPYYQLRIALPHDITREQLDAVIRRVDAEEMGSSLAPKRHWLNVDFVLGHSGETIASLSHQAGVPALFKNDLLGGTLLERAEKVLLAGDDRCSDFQPGRLSVVAGRQRVLFTYDTEQLFDGPVECAFSVAEMAFSRIEGLRTIVVRLRSSGEVFFEVECDHDTIFELGIPYANSSMLSEMHELNDRSEEGSRREYMEGRAKIDDAYQRVIAKIPRGKIHVDKYCHLCPSDR